MSLPPLNPKLLYDDKIASPRLKDIYHEIDFDNILDITKIIEGISEQLKPLKDDNILSEIPDRFLGIFIPLDSYIPLPEPYNTAFMKVSEDGDRFEECSINTITGCEIKTIVGDTENRSRVSIVLVFHPIDTSITLEAIEPKTLHDYYEKSLQSANKVISSYKLTPLRHNHDLTLVSSSNRDSTIQALIVDLKNNSVISRKSFEVQQNIFASIMHSRVMEMEELEYFASTHLKLSQGESEVHNLVKTLVEAVDARCLGNFEQSIIYADKYGELFLRFTYCHLLLSEFTYEEALQKTNSIVNIKSLLSKIAQRTNMTTRELKDKIRNEVWEEDCRKTRNDLNHNFLKQDIPPDQATKAINSSIDMVVLLADLLEGQDEETTNAMSIFKSTRWLISDYAEDLHESS